MTTRTRQQQSPSASPADRDQLLGTYRQTRDRTLAWCAPLSPEDCLVQSMEDASPPKWHLAHTTWFFEAFVLEPFAAGHQPYHPQYGFLFNSYYESMGDRQPRPQRGMLSRPPLADIVAYRHAVDEQLARLVDNVGTEDWPSVAERITLGIAHEEQHQELLLMDLKHNLWCHPLKPAYREGFLAGTPAAPGGWLGHPGGLVKVGHAQPGFAYDNETPRHRVHLEPFELASRLVTADEYLEFIDDGGYQRPELWLADGWSHVQQHGWTCPLYWQRHDDGWRRFTLYGMQPLEANAPVSHVSHFEAQAFACWKGMRLPSEAEWEAIAAQHPVQGHFADADRLEPGGTWSSGTQLFGDVWEHTSSSYSPYPGFEPLAGALGEYNGKFMCNQYVQRGGSCLTPRRHMRASYRNFFYPHQRWNTAGVRLARFV